MIESCLLCSTQEIPTPRRPLARPRQKLAILPGIAASDPPYLTPSHGSTDIATVDKRPSIYKATDTWVLLLYTVIKSDPQRHSQDLGMKLAFNKLTAACSMRFF